MVLRGRLVPQGEVSTQKGCWYPGGGWYIRGRLVHQGEASTQGEAGT